MVEVGADGDVRFDFGKSILIDSLWDGAKRIMCWDFQVAELSDFGKTVIVHGHHAGMAPSMRYFCRVIFWA